MGGQWHLIPFPSSLGLPVESPGQQHGLVPGSGGTKTQETWVRSWGHGTVPGFCSQDGTSGPAPGLAEWVAVGLGAARSQGPAGYTYLAGQPARLWLPSQSPRQPGQRRKPWPGRLWPPGAAGGKRRKAGSCLEAVRRAQTYTMMPTRHQALMQARAVHQEHLGGVSLYTVKP